MCREAQVLSRLYKVGFKDLQSGLSLVELISAITVVGVLSTVGLDSYQFMVGHAKADKEINSLQTALALARSESVVRDARVVLCHKDDAELQCLGNSSAGQKAWVNGWLLFVDVDYDRNYLPESGDLLLRQSPPLDQKTLLKWNRGDYIAYRSSGRLASLNGSFCLRWNGQEEFSRELKIPYTGRVRQTSGECSYDL